MDLQSPRPDLLTAVSTDDDTAYSLWRGVREIFRDNRSARAVYLNAEFRTFLQGDLSVLAYCTRMKAMADRLGDLGSPITNADLVQNIIRGLNPRLHHYVPHLTLRKRLPSFHKARSMLQMEEHRLAESAKLQAASALIAQAQRGAPPPPPVHDAVSFQEETQEAYHLQWPLLHAVSRFFILGATGLLPQHQPMDRCRPGLAISYWATPHDWSSWRTTSDVGSSGACHQQYTADHADIAA